MSLADDEPRLVTVQEYLEIDRQSQTKYEFVRGLIYSMTGASERHCLINVNLTYEIIGQLKNRKCRAYGGDMRVKAEAAELYTYPDLSVTCEPEGPKLEDKRADTLLNPTALFEILSPSTEGYDRGDKFEAYRGIPSLQDYVMISQDRMRVENFRRGDEGTWVLHNAVGEQGELAIPSIGCTLRLADLYDKVPLVAIRGAGEGMLGTLIVDGQPVNPPPVGE